MGNGATVQIGAGRTVSATGVTGANGTFAFDFNNTAAGRLILTTIADMSNYTLNALAAADFSITSSKSYTIVEGLSGNATKFGKIIDNNSLFTFSQTENDVNGDIILNVARQSQMGEIATDPNNKSSAPAVEDLLNRNTGTPQADRDPATVNTQVNNQINTRIADARVGTGMSAGDMTDGLRYWMQGFGTTTEQSRRKGIAGYDANIFGGTIGVDAEASDNTLVGLAFSYANTKLDSKNLNRTKTEVDSYQVTAYGSYGTDFGSYLNGYLTYSYNDVDQARHNVGIIGNTARADYHNDQYDARVEFGHDFRNVLNLNGVILTPELSAQYTLVDSEKYSEKGAGGLGLRNVDMDTMQALNIGLDVELGYQHNLQNGGSITPSINVGYAYEALGERLETTGNFIGGATSFTTKGADPAQHSVTGGVGLTFKTTSGWDVNANYDYTYKSDFDAHTGIVKAIYSF
jgi:outer membrane autotransporter protein